MKLRSFVQILFFVIIAIISVSHNLEKSGIQIPIVSAASLHALCPFGGVVSIYELVTSGRYVRKIHNSSFILMFIVFAWAIVAGPVFCSWVCPFGTFQEWISMLGRKIFKKKFNKIIPYSIDKYLKFIRYIVLIGVLIKTAQSAMLLFQNIDPYYALFNIWTDEVSKSALIVLGITIVISLLMERPFCKYMCPYGALLGLTNKIKLFRITRKESTCSNCLLCDKKCPMNIPLSKIDISRDHQCISCLECTSEAHCPQDTTMEMTFNKKAMGSRILGILVIVFFLGGVGGTMAVNLWETEHNGMGRANMSTNNSIFITGRTTFKEALKMNITKEQLKKILGGKLPNNLNMTIRDYAHKNGLIFYKIRSAFQ